MAKAYKCDICNRFYAHTNVQLYSIVDKGGSFAKELDICDDCYLKLVRLINKEEEQMKNAGTN